MLSRTIFHSLITKLILFAVLAATAGIVLRYYSLMGFMRDDLLSVVSSQQQELAQEMARDIDYKITLRQKLLANLATNLPLDLLGYPDQLSEWLAVHHDQNPLFSQGFMVAAPDGKPIALHPYHSERKKVNFADRDYFQGALAGKFTIGQVKTGRLSKEPVLPMAIPIKDASGHVKAILAGGTNIYTPGFFDSIRLGHIGKTGGYLLVSPQQQIFVAATKPELILKPTARPGVNPLHDRAMAGYRGSGVTVNAQGIEEVAAFSSVPSTGWFVVARLPTEEAFALISHTKAHLIRSSLTVMTVIVLLLSVVLVTLLRPLVTAADLANRMTHGELPLQQLPVKRADEIGYLTMAFNNLLEKLMASQAVLARMANHDALTGLPNRLLLSDRLNQEITRSQRSAARLAVLYIDLDGFKPINDSLGHDAGDEALVEIAKRLSSVVRETDTLARVGGDEFVVVMGDLAPELEVAQSAACAVATKCIEAVEIPMILKGLEQFVSLSIGIALGGGQSTIDGLIAAGDGAMYKAKQSGRGSYIVAV
jgi:diguanylate cyclase (GGDEF)-like protein